MNFLKALFGRSAAPPPVPSRSSAPPSVPSTWREYRSEECGYKIMLPFPSRGLREHSEDEDHPEYGKSRWFSVRSFEGNDDYGVWCYKLDQVVDSGRAERILNSKLKKGAVVVSRELHMGYPSIETFEENQKGIMYFFNKYVVVRDMVFSLVVIRGLGFNSVDYESDDIDIGEFKEPPPVARKPERNIKAFFASFEPT